jgi:Mg2+ and Co2+ transporter CorA
MESNDTLILPELVGLDTMSETTSPLSVAFEFQRSAVENTHEAIESGIEAQRQFNEAALDVTPAREVSEQSTDLVRTGVDSYFQAIESISPESSATETLRARFHEQLDALEESQLDAIEQFETTLGERADATDELLEEFLATLDEQVASFLETHDDLEEQTVAALEDLEQSVDELQTELDAQGEELQEQFEAQLEAVQQQLEDVSENVQTA